MSSTPSPADMKALAEWLESRTSQHALISASVPGVPVPVPLLLTPSRDGVKVSGLRDLAAPYRDHPERRIGTAVMLDLTSFLAHVNRFKTPSSAIFANDDPEEPSLTAVLDYHDPLAPYMGAHEGEDDGAMIKATVRPTPLPAFCQHRTHYRFPLSEEWIAWVKTDGSVMAQAEFAAFLEDRIGDVIVPPDTRSGDASSTAENTPPPSGGSMVDLGRLLGGNFAGPSKLLELSRGLQLHQRERVKGAVNLSTGEVDVVYESTHQDDKGGVLKVPNLFLIAIPVFRSGPLYQIAVRLRYRLKEGTVSWHYQLYRADKVFNHAFREATERAQMETSLPVFVGKPEA